MLTKRLRELVRRRWFRTWVLEGSLPKGRGRLRAIYGGSHIDKAYIAKRLFEGAAEEQYCGRSWNWQIPGLAEKLNCVIAITPAYRSPAARNTGEHNYVIPCWLYGEVEIAPADIEEGRSKSRRRDLRMLEKNNLSYEITTDEEELADFYDNMYMPTMRTSHGDGALPMGYEQMMRRLAAGDCELLLVTRNGKKIAGSLIVYDDCSPRLWSGGVLDANRDFMKMGAGTAVYLLSFRYLHSRGHKRINIGRSRAFLNDGALYFKRRFGLKLAGPSDIAFRLRLNILSARARDCLAANPFVYLHESELRAAVFTDVSELKSEDAWKRIWDENYVPGIAKVIINAFGDDKSLAGLSVPIEYRPQMELRAISARDLPESGDRPNAQRFQAQKP